MASKVEGYVLNLGGAPAGWHMVEGLGYLHPDIAVSLDNTRAQEFYDHHKKTVADAEKAWDAHEAEQEARGNRQNWRQPFERPEPPIKKVRVSESELAKGDEARAQHMAAARGAIRQAMSGSADEQVQAHEEAQALAAGQEG